MPVTDFSTKEKYEYLNGFGSHHEYVFLVSCLTLDPPPGLLGLTTIADPRPSPGLCP